MPSMIFLKTALFSLSNLQVRCAHPECLPLRSTWILALTLVMESALSLIEAAELWACQLSCYTLTNASAFLAGGW